MAKRRRKVDNQQVDVDLEDSSEGGAIVAPPLPEVAPRGGPEICAC